MYGDIPTECGGINRGDNLRVPQAPRGFPEVNLDTRGGITHALKHGSVCVKRPVGCLSPIHTSPRGMIVLFEK